MLISERETPMYRAICPAVSMPMAVHMITPVSVAESESFFSSFLSSTLTMREICVMYDPASFFPHSFIFTSPFRMHEQFIEN